MTAIHPSFARWVHRSTVFACVASVRDGDTFDTRVVVVNPTIIFVCDEQGGVKRLVKLAHIKSISISKEDMVITLTAADQAHLHVCFDVEDSRNLLPSSDLPMHVVDLLKAAGREGDVEVVQLDLDGRGDDVGEGGAIAHGEHAAAAAAAGDGSAPPPPRSNTNTILPSPTPMVQPVAPVPLSPVVIPDVPLLRGLGTSRSQAGSCSPMPAAAFAGEVQQQQHITATATTTAEQRKQNRFTSPPPLARGAAGAAVVPPPMAMLATPQPQRGGAGGGDDATGSREPKNTSPRRPVGGSPRAVGAGEPPPSTSYLTWIRQQRHEGAKLNQEIEDAIREFAGIDTTTAGSAHRGASGHATPLPKTFDYNRAPPEFTPASAADAPAATRDRNHSATPSPSGALSALKQHPRASEEGGAGVTAYHVPLFTALDFPTPTNVNADAPVPHPRPQRIPMSDAEALLGAHLATRPAMPDPSTAASTATAARQRSGSSGSSSTTLPFVADGAADVGSLILDRLSEDLRRHLPPPAPSAAAFTAPSPSPDVDAIWHAFTGSLPAPIIAQDFAWARDDAVRAVFAGCPGLTSLHVAMLEAEWGRRTDIYRAGRLPVKIQGATTLPGVKSAVSFASTAVGGGGKRATAAGAPADSMPSSSANTSAPEAPSVAFRDSLYVGNANANANANANESVTDATTLAKSPMWTAAAPTRAADAVWRVFLTAVAQEEAREAGSTASSGGPHSVDVAAACDPRQGAGGPHPSAQGLLWLCNLSHPLLREAFRELGFRAPTAFAILESEWLRRRALAEAPTPSASTPYPYPSADTSMPSVIIASSMPPPVTAEARQRGGGCAPALDPPPPSASVGSGEGVRHSKDAGDPTTTRRRRRSSVVDEAEREGGGDDAVNHVITAASPPTPAPARPPWATVNKLLKEFVTGAFVTLDDVEPIDIPRALEDGFKRLAAARGEPPVLLWHEVAEGDGGAAAGTRTPPTLHMVSGPAGEGFYFPADPQPESFFQEGVNRLVLVEACLGRLKDLQHPEPTLALEALRAGGYDTVRYLNIDQGMYVVHDQARLLPRYLVTFTVEKWKGGALQSAVLARLEHKTREIEDKMGKLGRMSGRVEDVKRAELKRLEVAAEGLRHEVDRTAAAIATRIANAAERANDDLAAAKHKLVMVDEGLKNGLAYLRKATQLGDPSTIEAAGQVLDTFLLKSEPSLHLPTVQLPTFTVVPGGEPLPDVLLRFETVAETPYHRGATTVAAVGGDGSDATAADGDPPLAAAVGGRGGQDSSGCGEDVPAPVTDSGLIAAAASGSPIRRPLDVDLSAYTTAFDDTGVLRFLAGAGRGRDNGPAGSKADANAMDLGEVSLTASAGAHPRATHRIASLCGAERGSFFLTQDQIGGWVCVDLKAHALSPSAYSLEHGVRGSDAFALRNWVFEASNDAVNWTELAKHTDDQCLGAARGAHTWPLAPPAGVFFRFFRVRLTSPCADSSAWCLCLGGLELYGVLRVGH